MSRLRDTVDGSSRPRHHANRLSNRSETKRNEVASAMFLMPRELAMAGLALAGLSLAGCGSNETDTAAGPKRSKAAATVVVDGSSTVYRISKAAQEAFEAVNPDITVVVDNHGTGGGFSRYLQGEVDIVDASRPAKQDEESKAKAQGIEWTRFLVGYDGITLVVNPKNTFVKSLTVDAAQEALAARLHRQDLEGPRSLPGPTARSSSTLPTTTRERSSSSPRRSSARRRASATACSRAPTTTRS